MKTTTIFLTAILLVASIVSGQEQGNQGESHSSAAKQSQTLGQQLTKLRVEMARLQAALDKNHKGKRPGHKRGPMAGKMGKGGMKMGMGMKPMDKKKPGMGMMSMDKKKPGMGMMSKGKKMGGMGMKPKMPQKKPVKMGMGSMGMKGMKMMGMSPRQGVAKSLSTLPGFPGFSHLYHIGSTGFFLDHREHLELNKKQRGRLAAIQEKSSIEQATSNRNEEQIEQDLWVLTSSDSPNIKLIQAKLAEGAKLQVARRLAFIRAVGDAAQQLTTDQRKKLAGDAPSEAKTPESKPSASKGM